MKLHIALPESGEEKWFLQHVVTKLGHGAVWDVVMEFQERLTCGGGAGV
jgi:hypothetical protein